MGSASPLGSRLRATGIARLTPSCYGDRAAHPFALRGSRGSRLRATGIAPLTPSRYGDRAAPAFELRIRARTRRGDQGFGRDDFQPRVRERAADIPVVELDRPGASRLEDVLEKLVALLHDLVARVEVGRHVQQITIGYDRAAVVHDDR